MLVKISAEPIDVQSLMDAVRTDHDGAIAMFVGTVRNHAGGRLVEWLEYSAYLEMAEQAIRVICQEARQKFEVGRMAVVHRIGRMEIGASVVAVVVASAHRAAALDAVRYIIDCVKAEVPIWKKEFYRDKTVSWIHADNSSWEYRLRV